MFIVLTDVTHIAQSPEVSMISFVRDCLSSECSGFFIAKTKLLCFCLQYGILFDTFYYLLIQEHAFI